MRRRIRLKDRKINITGNVAIVHAENVDTREGSGVSSWDIAPRFLKQPSGKDLKVWTKKLYARACRELAKKLNTDPRQWIVRDAWGNLHQFDEGDRVASEERIKKALTGPPKEQDDSS